MSQVAQLFIYGRNFSSSSMHFHIPSSAESGIHGRCSPHNTDEEDHPEIPESQDPLPVLLHICGARNPDSYYSNLIYIRHQSGMKISVRKILHSKRSSLILSIICFPIVFSLFLYEIPLFYHVLLQNQYPAETYRHISSTKYTDFLLHKKQV